ncbi:MAG: pyridoxal-phosphate dependent enzyme [Myxococcales bacterium]|nr:pyridoxal-phosphate dependent enzyme [Myxococcales bacterium]
MGEGVEASLGRRAFLVGSGALAACDRRSRAPQPSVEASSDAEADAARPGDPDASIDRPASTFALFDAFPALAAALPRVELGRFPSPIERARSLVPGRLWIKRDDDFTRAASWRETFEPARTFGGGKVRKLELYFGEARARGARRIVTFGGVGSNQALAAALLGRALGFSVRLYLAPQPPSSLTAQNLAADAASRAEMRLFDSVAAAQAEAQREARGERDTYIIPPGGTTPLGTLGFVSAGLELAADVRAGAMPTPRRVYVALGLGGSAVGLSIGCALGGLATEIVGVRASTPSTVTATTLRAIHRDTVAFARARDPAFPALAFDGARVRIDGRFVGGGYGVPTRAGDDAVSRAHAEESWSLDPVYTGKALAAVLDDARDDAALGPLLFWNTASSRAVSSAPVPPAFRRWTRP